MIYAHAKGQEASMIYHCWDEAPLSIKIPPHSEIDLSVHNFVKRRGVDKCSPDTDQSSYYSCTKSTLGKRFLDTDLASRQCYKESFQPCVIPQVRDYIKQSTINIEPFSG